MMPTVINAFGGKRGFMKHLRRAGYVGAASALAYGGIKGIDLGMKLGMKLAYKKGVQDGAIAQRNNTKEQQKRKLSQT